MARPERNNVDYFPFLCEDGNKMFYLEETYGNDGFATFVKLLRELAKTNYHYLDLSKPSTMMFLSAKCKVTQVILNSIITDLVELGKIDRVLWNENKVVWCQDFVDSIQDAYSKRNNKCITYEGLLLLLVSLGVRKQGKLLSTVPVNTQSIVKESIEDKKKEDNIYRKFNHLSLLIEDFEKLNLEYDKNIIDEVLDKIENYKNNKNYKSLYLTAKNWLKKEEKSSDKKEEVIGRMPISTLKKNIDIFANVKIPGTNG